MHELVHQLAIMIDDELLTEAVQCFLDALMASE
jgi:Arc/MetJ family transcription regulator